MVLAPEKVPLPVAVLPLVPPQVPLLVLPLVLPPVPKAKHVPLPCAFHSLDRSVQMLFQRALTEGRARTHAHVRRRMCAHARTHKGVCTSTYARTHERTHTHTYARVRPQLYVNPYARMCICERARSRSKSAHARTQTYVRARIYARACAHPHVRAHM
eukprot:6195168-Pleurochrysis_carterae.AAC.1